MSATFDLNDLKRRMQASIASLKHEFGGLRTGRAAASLVEPVHVEAYGQSMPLNQVATISIPEARMIQIQVWDKAMVIAVDKAIRAANLGLTPTVEGQILRVRMPELNEQRRKEAGQGRAQIFRGSARRDPPRPPRRPRYPEEAAQGQGYRRGRREASRNRGAEGDRRRHRRGRSGAGDQGKGDHAGLGGRMVLVPHYREYR